MLLSSNVTQWSSTPVLRPPWEPRGSKRHLTHPYWHMPNLNDSDQLRKNLVNLKENVLRPAQRDLLPLKLLCASCSDLGRRLGFPMIDWNAGTQLRAVAHGEKLHSPLSCPLAVPLVFPATRWACLLGKRHNLWEPLATQNSSPCQLSLSTYIPDGTHH